MNRPQGTSAPSGAAFCASSATNLWALRRVVSVPGGRSSEGTAMVSPLGSTFATSSAGLRAGSVLLRVRSRRERTASEVRASGGRRAGLFAMRSMTRLSTSFSTPGTRPARSGGGSFTCAFRIAATDGRRYGASPASAAKIVAPAE